MAEALKQRLAHSGNKAATQRKVFSTFIEMAQNVIHYSADTFSDVDQQDDELRHGAVWIGESEGSSSSSAAIRWRPAGPDACATG